MATRSITVTFAELRADARRERHLRQHPSRNHSADANDPLMLQEEEHHSVDMSSVEGEIARQLALKQKVEAVIPEWQQKIKPLESALDNILLEMSDLQQLRAKRLHNLFDNTNDAKISLASKRITRLIGEVKNEIRSLGANAQMSCQENQMRENIQKVFLARLQDIGGRFTKDQLRYQHELESTTSSKPQKKTALSPSIATTSSSADHTSIQLDEEDDDDNAVTYDFGFTTQQQARSEVSRIRIEQRMREIGDIAQQVEELNQMFVDIGTMIHEQGSLLDRIDYNIELADHSITVGKKELTEVTKSEQGVSKLWCCVLVSVIIAGTIVIVAVLLKTR